MDIASLVFWHPRKLWQYPFSQQVWCAGGWRRGAHLSLLNSAVLSRLVYGLRIKVLFVLFAHLLRSVEQNKKDSVSVTVDVDTNSMDMTCSDITNTQVGISGETVPEGGNLCIYRPHSNHTIWWVVVLTFEAGVSHHTPPLPGGAGLYRQFLMFWIIL